MIRWIVCGALALLILSDGWNFFRLSHEYCLNRDEILEPRPMSHCGMDMDQYVDLSNSLMQGHGFAAKFVTSAYGLFGDADFYIPETNRMPGYPLLLSALRTINPARRTLLYFNLLCYFVITAGAGFFTWRFLGGVPGLVTALWLLNNDQLRHWTLGGSSDIVATAALVIFVCALFMRRESWSSLFLCFAASVAGTFMRSNTFLLFIPLLLTTLVLQRRPRLMIPLLGLIFCLGAWCGRNYLVSGRPTLSTMSGHQLFLQYPMSDLDSDEAQWDLWYSGPSFDSVRAVKAGENVNHAWARIDAHSGDLARQWLWHHPLAALQVFSIGWVKFFSFRTEGWMKTPMDFFSAETAAVFYTLLLLSTLVMAVHLYLTTDADEKSQAASAVALNVATLTFLLVSAFWHGDWIGVRGSMEVLPCLFFFSFYALRIFKKSIARHTDSSVATDKNQGCD